MCATVATGIMMRQRTIEPEMIGPTTRTAGVMAAFGPCSTSLEQKAAQRLLRHVAAHAKGKVLPAVSIKLMACMSDCFGLVAMFPVNLRSPHYPSSSGMLCVNNNPTPAGSFAFAKVLHTDKIKSAAVQ